MTNDLRNALKGFTDANLYEVVHGCAMAEQFAASRGDSATRLQFMETVKSATALHVTWSILLRYYLLCIFTVGIYWVYAKGSAAWGIATNSSPFAAYLAAQFAQSASNSAVNAVAMQQSGLPGEGGNMQSLPRECTDEIEGSLEDYAQQLLGPGTARGLQLPLIAQFSQTMPAGKAGTRFSSAYAATGSSATQKRALAAVDSAQLALVDLSELGQGTELGRSWRRINHMRIFAGKDPLVVRDVLASHGISDDDIRHSVPDGENPSICMASLALMLHAVDENAGPMGWLWERVADRIERDLRNSNGLRGKHDGAPQEGISHRAREACRLWSHDLIRRCLPSIFCGTGICPSSEDRPVLANGTAYEEKFFEQFRLLYPTTFELWSLPKKVTAHGANLVYTYNTCFACLAATLLKMEEALRKI
jgi:hypothetical protein